MPPKSDRKERKRTRGARAYKTGLWAEALARLFLRLKFYRILGVRVATPLGEIDMIATRGHTLVFIEVKARQTLQQAHTALSDKQKNRLAHAAAYYLAAHPAFNQYVQRFDLVLIVPGHLPQHFIAAF